MAINQQYLGRGASHRSPEENMKRLLNDLKVGVIVPQPNKYYTFVYKAKTKNIQYDQHPLILCGDVFQWGFTGFNYHWESIRRYTWGEVLTNLFEVKETDMDFLKDYPTQRLRFS